VEHSDEPVATVLYNVAIATPPNVDRRQHSTVADQLTEPLDGPGAAQLGKHSAADVIAKAQTVLSEPQLFDVGYSPPNTPPDNSNS
jgi:hypothetical protein